MRYVTQGGTDLVGIAIESHHDSNGLAGTEIVSEINWREYSEAIPAFFTMLLMPLAYSISDGIMIGVIIYVFVNMLTGNFKKLNITLYVLAVLFIAYYVAMIFIK